MKHSLLDSRHLLLVLAPLLVLSAGCKRSSRPSYLSTIDFVDEVERNDLVDEANDLGFLAPGDRVVINGSITDIPFDPFNPNNGHDPFDGFSFVSTQPIHIDFRLIAFNFADLDLCVYDTTTDAIEFCFESSAQPEIGGIDILDPGVEFHLIVESYFGNSNYRLEIDVEPLYGYSAPTGLFATAGTHEASKLAGDERSTLAAPGRADAYRRKVLDDEDDTDAKREAEEVLARIAEEE